MDAVLGDHRRRVIAGLALRGIQALRNGQERRKQRDHHWALTTRTTAYFGIMSRGVAGEGGRRAEPILCPLSAPSRPARCHRQQTQGGKSRSRGLQVAKRALDDCAEPGRGTRNA